MTEPRKPVAAFDFNAAAGGAFHTQGGKAFAIRLWFWMAAFTSIVFIVTLPLFMKHYGGFLEMNWLNMKAMMSGETPDSAGFTELIIPALPGYLTLMLGMWVVMAAGETAFYKKYYFNEEAPRQPLKLNGDVFRTMGVQISVYLCWALGLFVFTFIGSLIAAILAFVPILSAIFVLFFAIALIALMVAIPIKLAPSAALTVANDKFHVPSTRHVTKFRFWNLFLAYLVTWVGGYLMYTIVMTLAVALATGDPGFMGAISGLSEENPRIMFEAAAEKFSNPLFMFLGIIAMIIVAGAFSAWQMLIMGVNAYAVRWWKEDNPTPNFE